MTGADGDVRERVLAFCRRLPKVELHVHLEGTLSAERLLAIARRDGREVPAEALQPAAADGERSFAAFLRSFLARYFALRTPDDYATLVDDLLREQVAQNVPYTEAFVTFEGALRGRYVLRDVLTAMAEVERSWHARGAALRLVVDGPRTLGPEVCEALFRLAAADPTGLCVGVGLGGDEDAAPSLPFVDAYRRAREAGLRLTAHAGEHAGPESVAHAVDELGVERIGHGCSAAADEGLMRRLRDRGVTVDCCPGSNLATGAWAPERGPHPVRRFVDAGVRVDIGSDDPAVFGTTVSEEWAALVLEHGFSPHECLELTVAAVDATFLEAAARDRLRAHVEARALDVLDEAAALEEALSRP